MESPIAVQQREWVLAGIRHEIFMRVFPALRHGLVGPVSIARMSVSIVRRLLSKGDAGKAVLNEPVERIDQQLAEAVTGIRALQAWEPGAKGLATPAEVLRQGMSLMTASLALRDIKLDYVPSDIQEVEEVHHQPFLYAWLALLCHVEDSVQAPVSLRIEQKQPKSVSVEIIHSLYDVNQDKTRPAAHVRLIDQAALELMAAAGGLQLTSGEGWMRLSWI